MKQIVFIIALTLFAGNASAFNAKALNEAQRIRIENENLAKTQKEAESARIAEKHRQEIVKNGCSVATATEQISGFKATQAGIDALTNKCSYVVNKFIRLAREDNCENPSGYQARVCLDSGTSMSQAYPGSNFNLITRSGLVKPDYFTDCTVNNAQTMSVNFNENNEYSQFYAKQFNDTYVYRETTGDNRFYIEAIINSADPLKSRINKAQLSFSAQASNLLAGKNNDISLSNTSALYKLMMRHYIEQKSCLGIGLNAYIHNLLFDIDAQEELLRWIEANSKNH